MKTKIYIAALMALTACSNDDVIDSNPTDPTEITFSVTTNNATRASELYDSANNPSSFQLWAVISPTSTSTSTATMYFKNQEVALNSSGKWAFSDGKARYFPVGRTLDFFAFNDDVTVTPTLFEAPSISYTTIDGNKYTTLATGIISVKPNTSEQKDVLYAVTSGIDSNSVPLNFCHALAQLNFKIENKTQFYVVQVNKITLQHIYTNNCQIYLNTNAETNGKNYTYNSAKNNNYSTITWNVPTVSDPTQVCTYNEDLYEYWQKQVSTEVANDKNYLQCGPATSTSSTTLDILGQDATSAMLVIPQIYKPGSYHKVKIGTDMDITPYEEDDGSSSSAPRRNVVSRTDTEVPYRWVYTYFKLSCRIYSIIDVADYQTAKDGKNFNMATYLASNANIIWGGDDDSATPFQDIYIPVPGMTVTNTTTSTSTGGDTQAETPNTTTTSYEWLAGNKYIYTFTFGADNANGQDSTGNPVFPAIDLSVSIDNLGVSSNPDTDIEIDS